MTAESMILQVAAAIANTEVKFATARFDMRYEEMARAALSAMREPTEAMITALLHEKVRDTADQHERDVATLDWQFLIDQALK